MSSHVFATAIELVPRASAFLRIALLIVHGCAFAILAICADTHPWLLLLLPVLLVHWAWSHRRYGLLRGHHVIRRVVWRSDGTWAIAESGTDMREARLLSHSFLHPALLVLNFRRVEDGARRAVILCRDSETDAVLRRLRRRLYLHTAHA